MQNAFPCIIWHGKIVCVGVDNYHLTYSSRGQWICRLTCKSGHDSGTRDTLNRRLPTRFRAFDLCEHYRGILPPLMCFVIFSLISIAWAYQNLICSPKKVNQGQSNIAAIQEQSLEIIPKGSYYSKGSLVPLSLQNSGEFSETQNLHSSRSKDEQGHRFLKKWKQPEGYEVLSFSSKHWEETS